MNYLQFGLESISTNSSVIDITNTDSNSNQEFENPNYFELSIDINMNIDGKHYVKERAVELNAIQIHRTIKVGFKAWCVHLDITDEFNLILENLTYATICAKDQNLPTGLLGTLPMLKAAINLARHCFPILDDKFLYITDNTGFADNRSGDDIALHTLYMCLYQQTWYQRKLCEKIEPEYENDKAKIKHYKTCLDEKVTSEYISIVSRFVRDFKSKINIDKFLNEKESYTQLSYTQLFNMVYKRESNNMYRVFITTFINHYNLPSLHGILWKMKISDMNYDGLQIRIKQRNTGFELSGGHNYIEKVQLSRKIIARRNAFLD